MKETAALRRRILSRQATLAVVGQTHAGLSLACASADAGFRVTALDPDGGLINDLQRGVLSVPGVAEHAFRGGLASQRLRFSAGLEAIKEADVVAICLPAPVQDQPPDLAQLEETCLQIGRHLRPGQLIMLESAVYPGTTEERVLPALESSGLSGSHDFLLAFSPERVDPESVEHAIQNTPRLVGGMTREATGVAALFLGQFVDKVIQLSSCRAAEMANFLESAFRHVNVGLVNEMAVFCREQGIDVWEVVDAAATKPFGFMSFHPGVGVGGHSISIDPMRLGSDQGGGFFRILDEARAANARMATYVVSRIDQALSENGRSVQGARILALGVTGKPDVGDTVDSPGLKVLAQLKQSGARIAYHDPYVPELMMNGTLVSRSLLTERSVDAADCVAILTPHTAYDLDWIARHAHLIFDARNAYGPDRRPNVVRL